MDEEDEIIGTIPVFLSQNLSEKLFIYQYPVKPQDSDFSKAKVLKSLIKPINQEVKVELALNTESNFYDSSKGEEIAINADGMSNDLRLENNKPNACFVSGLMDKQCYMSSKAVESTDVKKYAVAYLNGTELHCTPLQSIVQMRPNFFYFDKHDKHQKTAKTEKEVDSDDEEIKQVTVKFARTESAKTKMAREKSFDFFSKRSAEEPWCETTFHHKTSNEAEFERMRLVCDSSNDISHSLSLPGDKYAQVLIPPETCNELPNSSLPSHIISRNSLRTLPLLEQCKLLLKEVRMITFQNVCTRLAQESASVDKLLKILPQAGLAVRGNWTARSEVLYPENCLSTTNGVPADLMCRGRDYVMYLFSKSEYINRHRIASVIKLPPEEVKDILLSVAKLNADGKQWELLLPPDAAFEQKYADIVQRQQLFWQAKEKQFAEMLDVSSNTGKRQRKKSQRDSFSLSDDQNNKNTSIKIEESKFNGNVRKRERKSSYVDGDTSDKNKSNKSNKKMKFAYKV